MSIYVGNLSFDVTKDILTDIFVKHGTIQRVHWPTDQKTGQMHGFAFVEMETDAEESGAIDALNGFKLMGRDLKVNKAKY